MLNNQIFDQPCFHQARRNPRLQRSQTAIIDLRYPSPLTSEDLVSSNSSNQLPSTTTQIPSTNNDQSRLPNMQGPPKLTRNYSIASNRDLIPDEPGKMSQEMKRQLANDLL
uniref:Uncharacterized protein n=1 Tax=Panagrolaimus sp. ES5 TaxID=591445 RepID=A0AC34GI07_9BILA